MKKLLSLCVMSLLTLTISAQSYVDLGLPSGTKWKTTNERGFYTYEEAYAFGENLPAQWQLEELKDHCDWLWTGNGYKVTGSNGKSIFFPAAGYQWGCNDDGIYESGSTGYLWSSAYKGTGEGWGIIFASGGIYGSYSPGCMGQSVRLVQNP